LVSTKTTAFKLAQVAVVSFLRSVDIEAGQKI